MIRRPPLYTKPPEIPPAPTHEDRPVCPACGHLNGWKCMKCSLAAALGPLLKGDT